MSFAIVLGPVADDGSSPIASMASGTIVPSWARGPRGQPTRLAAERACSRSEEDQASVRWMDAPTNAAHPLLGGAQARMTQPRPDLAGGPRPVEGAVEGAAGQHPPDRLEQGRVRHRARRPRPAPRRRRRPGPRRRLGAVGRRPSARRAPDPAGPGCAVAAARGGRDDGARRAGVRGPKGPTAAALRQVDLGPEQLGVHRQLAELGLEPADRLVPVVARARLQARLARLRGARRATRRERPPPPRARAPPAPAARPAARAARAAPRSPCALPPSAAPAPTSQALGPPRPRPLRAHRRPSRHLHQLIKRAVRDVPANPGAGERRRADTFPALVTSASAASPSASQSGPPSCPRQSHHENAVGGACPARCSNGTASRAGRAAASRIGMIRAGRGGRGRSCSAASGTRSLGVPSPVDRARASDARHHVVAPIRPPRRRSCPSWGGVAPRAPAVASEGARRVSIVDVEASIRPMDTEALPVTIWADRHGTRLDLEE